MGKHIFVLYEDDHFMVFDKPPGLLVIPSPKQPHNTLRDFVNEQYAKDSSWNLHPCHRLDRDTSGAIVFAKGKRNQQYMMQQFKDREVRKTYLAFIHGKLKKNIGTIEKSIKLQRQKYANKKAVAISALTKYKVIDVRRHYSIIEVSPITGRKNQIRIHFSQLGHPLVGERKFAFARDYALKFRRTALHAVSLQWKDLETGQYKKVTSNLPKDMEVFRARN